MGLLATGISCFAHVKVRGLRRVPLPPLKMRAFIPIPNVISILRIITCYLGINFSIKLNTRVNGLRKGPSPPAI